MQGTRALGVAGIAAVLGVGGAVYLTLDKSSQENAPIMIMDYLDKDADCAQRGSYGGQNRVLCDLSPALNLALAACEARVKTATVPMWAGTQDIACELHVPNGLFYINTTVDICHTVSIDFHNAKVFHTPDRTALRFLGFQACKDANRPQSGSSELSNLYLRPYGVTSTVTLEAGIEIHAPVKLQDIKVLDEDIGILVYANATHPTVNLRANANSWLFQNVQVQRSKFRGVDIDGPDVNVGLGIGVKSTSNCQAGSALLSSGTCADIYDGSFLGATWVGASTGYAKDTLNNAVFKGIVLGDSANSRSVCLGCYIENGYGGGEIAATANVIGGIGAWTGGGNRLEGNRISGLEAVGSDGLLSVKLGALTGGGALTLTPLGDSGSYPLRFKYQVSNGGVFYVDVGNSSSARVFDIGAKNTTPILGLGGLMFRRNNSLPNVFLNTSGYIVQRQVP